MVNGLNWSSSNEPECDKTNKITCAHIKIQISLGICTVWSESSLCPLWVAKGPNFLQVHSELWSDWVNAQADLSLCWAHVILLVFVMLWLKYNGLRWTCSKPTMSPLARLWYLSHRRPAKAQGSLRIQAVWPESSLFAKIKYGSRQKIWPKMKMCQITT